MRCKGCTGQGLALGSTSATGLASSETVRAEKNTAGTLLLHFPGRSKLSGLSQFMSFHIFLIHFFFFDSPSTSPCVFIVSLYFCIKKLVANREEEFSAEA